MDLPRKLFSCLAAALLCAPPLASSAATAHLPRELVISHAHVAGAVRGMRPDEASGRDVGSANTVTADAPVPRPHETPCIAPIFTDATFSQYAPQTFPYTPPAGCPGPYAKIVFNGNFGVTKGIQFDRTAAIEIGNVPIYFGTTAEPSPNLGPTWHVERDVTAYAALLTVPQTTEADIFNIVNSQYTGVIHGTTFLQFYPAAAHYPAAAVPDVVLPFPGVPGGPQQLPTPTSQLTATYTLPLNTESAYLDVYAQSQQTDEQYFNCAPTNVAGELFACPNGPLRQTEIAIDGKPAGVAPVYPWIYTGGLDPYLWFPLPGVQTLEFVPYRIDLTPFAGLLANGASHTISLSVDNADNYFQAIGTLLVYEDHGSTQVTGGLLEDTLVPDPPEITVEHLQGTSPSVDGTIRVSSSRRYAIKGFVSTSKGRVTTYVSGALEFDNHQSYSNESDFTGTLVVHQQTNASTVVTTLGRSGLISTVTDTVSFPLAESLVTVLDDTGTGTQVSKLDQHFVSSHVVTGPGVNYASYVSNEVAPTDTLDILDDEYITGNSNQSSVQRYSAYDSTGACYSQTITAANNVVTAVTPPHCTR